MKLGIVAPFNCHLNLNTPHLMTNYPDFKRFCHQLLFNKEATNGALFQAGDVEFNVPLSDGVKYDSVQEDGKYHLDPEIFTIMAVTKIQPFAAAAHAHAFACLESINKEWHFQVEVQSCDFKFYDNAIGLATILMEINPGIPESNAEAFIHFVEKWASAFTENLVEKYYQAKLFPILDYITRLCTKNKNGFMQAVEDYPEYLKFSLQINANDQKGNTGKIKWANRTLFVDSFADLDFDLLEKAWIVSTLGQELLRDELIPEKPVFLGWGNNVAVGPPDQNHTVQALKALHICQYFYTIFDNLGPSLLSMVGESMKEISIHKSARQRKILESVITKVAIYKIQFDDLFLSLQGNTHMYVQDLQKRWHLDILFNGVENKLDLCKAQVERIQQRAQKLGQTVVESILFVIGGISLIEFFKNLADAGKNLNLKTDGFPGVLDVAGSFAPDVVIWFGIFLFATACGIFAHFQRRR
ncbi:MAG: hypothetical protein DWQ05_16385 [Calditrichaeota bacterium]|nr:MAG: hypothetical protein DWQ05_16385 [Calditrichota bacterium]